MVAGIIPALIFPYLFEGTLDLYYFPYILLLSLGGALAGTFLTKPTAEETLKSFYKTVNPWGFWRPVREKVIAENPDFRPNKDFKRDMFNVVVGTVGQTGLTALPIFIVLQKGMPVWISLLVVACCLFILKKTWWNKLPER